MRKIGSQFFDGITRLLPFRLFAHFERGVVQNGGAAEKHAKNWAGCVSGVPGLEAVIVGLLNCNILTF